MKKPLRLLAALLAFCVAAATFPPVGLALEENDLRTLINQAGSSGVVDLEGRLVLANDVSVNGSSLFASFVIDQPITIQNGTVTVRAGGIVLGADTTFSNVEFSFPSATEGGNFIAANGHTLTLENVTCAENSPSFNLFCGAFTGNSHPTVTLPPPGTEGTILVKENVSIQGRSSSGNVYAGNVYRTRDGNGFPDKIFQGNASISVLASKNSLGAVYGCGATADGSVTQADETYTVSGTVRVAGNVPDVCGAGTDVTEVIYQGGGNQADKSFQNISSLSVESGNLVLKSGSSFQAGGTLSVSDGAFLNIKDLGNPSVSDFHGGGSLILGQNQTLTIENQVTGATKVGIGSIFNNASQTIPLENHAYIKAPQSQAGTFVLVPSNSKPDMKLERDGSGNWTVPVTVVEASKVVSLTPKDTQLTSGEIEVLLPLNVVYTGEPLGLDTLALTIRVNGSTAVFDSDEECYEAAGLRLYVGDLGNGRGEQLMVYSAASFDDPVPDGTYDIEITVPGTDTQSGAPITASCTLTVGDSAPAVKTIPIPKANTGLKWTGAEQTGVDAGEGYTLSGTFKATTVGNYTATAALEPGYQWTGGSTDPQTISWSIAKANSPAAPTDLAGTAPTASGGADGKITGTTSAMEYAANPSFTNSQECGDGETGGLFAGTYYVRVKETATHEAGASTSITVPAPGAATVTGISVSSTAHKTAYKVGESLDVTGLTIEAVYSNGDRRTVPVTADMVGGFDSSDPAESQTLTITYEGRSASYTVRITASQQPGGTKYQVTVSNTGSGGTEAGAYDYEEGASVTIRAGGKNGYTFAAWEATGVTLANRGVPEISFTMPANNVTLHAIWTPNSVTPPSGHTHAWSASWQSGKTHHWHSCTASGCSITQDSLKSGYAAHTAGDWVVDQSATSSQSGTRHRSCTVCGYEMIRETIPATGGSSSGGSSSGSGSSSGGSSSSGSSSSNTTTVKNPDGSSTSTNTNKTTGTVTETTRRPDGSKTVVETKKDGTVTTTDTVKDGSTVKTVARPDGSTETTVKQASGLTASIQENQNSAKADVRIPSKVLQENPRDSVALPIPALPGKNASVTIHTGIARLAAVEIPVYGNDNTTVACLVNPDGSETILKTAILSGGQMTVSVSDGATVRIRENGKNFQDTRGHWARSAIDFVSARELFSGKTSSSFAPDASMSRAMLMTVLARLDGVDTAGGPVYQKGMTWAVAQGISDGRNPDSQVTREQFVAMLHRYAGNPAATDRELHFSDTENISAYARAAVRWAVENGILSGYGDGSFLPEGKTTRAQAAAMLERYVKYLNQQ